MLKKKQKNKKYMHLEIKCLLLNEGYKWLRSHNEEYYKIFLIGHK